MNSLKGVKVLELAGLAPAPFAGKYGQQSAGSVSGAL